MLRWDVPRSSFPEKAGKGPTVTAAHRCPLPPTEGTRPKARQRHCARSPSLSPGLQHRTGGAGDCPQGRSLLAHTRTQQQHHRSLRLAPPCCRVSRTVSGAPPQPRAEPRLGACTPRVSPHPRQGGREPPPAPPVPTAAPRLAPLQPGSPLPSMPRAACLCAAALVTSP